MTSVFISYSRKDTAFARQLFDALTGAGRDAWVDWEGIPYSADWWREICAGIDAAESFVFIISPDALVSMVCHQELAYARTNRKRIIPIMHREADEKTLAGEWLGQEWEATARDNWGALRHLNWLFFREQDNFENAFAALIQTIEQDLEHLRLHTRLLVRAREWQSSPQRDSGLLLRGDDLRQAESWLEFNSSKQPQPTDLHKAYILASTAQRQREEEAERRQRDRLRMLVAVLSVLLVVAISASGIAVNRTQVADANAVTAIANANTATVAQGLAEINEAQAAANAETAESNANRAATNEALAEANAATAAYNAAEANSQALAANALQAANEGDLDLAIVQALIANQIDQPKFQARRALYRVGYAIGMRKVIPVEKLSLEEDGETTEELRSSLSAQAVAYTPDGLELIIDAGGQIIVVDAQTGEERRRFFTEQPGFGDLIITPDGRYVLAVIERLGLSFNNPFTTGPILMLDLQTGEEIRRFTGMDEQANPEELVVSPDARWLFLRQAFNELIYVWDLESGALAHEIDTDHTLVLSLAVSPDSSTVILTGDGVEAGVQAYDLTHDFAPLYRLDKVVGFADIHPDGRTFITSWRDGLHVYDLKTGEELRHIPDTFSGIESTSFIRTSPDGRLALVATLLGRLRLYDLESGERIETLEVTPGSDIYDVHFNPDSLSFASTDRDDVVRLWDLSPTDLIARRVFPQDGYAYWTTEGELIVYRVIDGVLTAYDYESETIISQLPVGSAQSVMSVSADGRRALLKTDDTLATLFDMETGAPLNAFPIPDLTLSRVFLTPDGSQMVIFRTEVVGIMDTSTGEVVSSRELDTIREQILGAAESIMTGAIAADMSAAVIGTSTGRIMLFSLPDWTLVKTFRQTDSSLMLGVAFSPDSTLQTGRVLSVGERGQLMLWDIANGGLLHSFRPRAPLNILQIAFSPDGRTASVVGYFPGADSTYEITLWNIFRADELAPWLHTYRAVRELTCEEREQFNLVPGCTLTGYYPTLTPYPVQDAVLLARAEPAVTRVLPTRTPLPTLAPTLDITSTPHMLTDQEIRAALANIDFDVVLPRQIDTFPLAEVSAWRIVGFGLEPLFGTPAAELNAFVAGYGSGISILQLRSPYEDVHAWAEASELGSLAAQRGLLTYEEFAGIETVQANLFGLNIALEIVVWIDRDLLFLALSTQTGLLQPDTLVNAHRNADTFAPVLTATTVSGLIARRGDNRAELPDGGAHGWTYHGEGGERLRLYVAADHPANTASIEERIAQGMLDSSMIVYAPDGTEIGANDDINPGILTNSLIPELFLPVAGEYVIKVSSYGFTGGAYTLSITSSLMPTPTPTPTLTPTLTRTPTPTITRTPITTLIAPSDDLTQVVFAQISADNRYLMTSGEDDVVRLWDADTGEWLRSHAGFSPNAPAFSPDGARYLTNNIPNIIQVWDSASGELLTALEGHIGQVNRARWSPDGLRIVTGGADGSVRVWDAATGEELLRLFSHLDEVVNVRFSPDGSRLLSISYDSNVLIWDAFTGAELAIIHVEHPDIAGGFAVNNAVFSPDGQRIAVMGVREAAIYDVLDTSEPQFRLEGHPDVFFAAWSPDASKLLTTSSEERTAKVWDTQTGGLIFTLDRPSGEYAINDFSADGMRAVSYDAHNVYFWDMITGDLLHEISYEAAVVNLSWSPDRSCIAVTLESLGVDVLNSATGEVLLSLR